MFDTLSKSPALWIKSHFQAILSVMAVCALAGLGFIGYKTWSEKQNQQVRKSLYQLKKSLYDMDPNKEDPKALPDLLKDQQLKSLKLTPKMKETAAQYAELIKKRHKTKASAEFALDLADFYYRYNEKEKAKSLLALFALPKKTSAVYHLIAFQLASYYTNPAECEKALALLEALRQNKKAIAFHQESALKEGLCFELTGQKDKALARYEEILQKDPDSWTGQQAQDYRRILILSRNIQKSQEGKAKNQSKDKL